MCTGKLYHVLIGLLIVIPIEKTALGQTVYQHPQYNIGFQAGPGWHQEMGQNGGDVFQVTNPNNNMRINLSYIPGCKNPEKYLKRMSGMKGMVDRNGIYDTILDDRKAVIMRGMYLEGKRPFRRMVIGFYALEGVYLFEMCCPEDCYINHREKMHTILESIRIGA